MSEPVSIIIPTRNRSAILARCLAALPEGVRGLDPPEVIVVDDCSSDATPQVVEEFARSSGWHVICHSQQRPLGANAARNQALKIAGGQTIVFIDDDVIVTDGWLPKLLSGLTTEVSVVAGAVRVTMEGPLIGRHREEVRSFFAEVLTPPLGLDGEVVPILGNMAAYRWVFEAQILMSLSDRLVKRAIGSGAPEFRRDSCRKRSCGTTRRPKRFS